MSSKVLKDADAGAAPVPWRRISDLGSQAARPPAQASAEEPEPGAPLRAKVAELETALETKTREAYNAGVRAGEESARRKLEAEVRETVKQLAAAIADLAQTREETIRRAEADLVRLSIEIARRVLHRELSTDGSALEGLIKAAVEKLQAQEVFRVRVHPDRQKDVRACLDRTDRGQAIEVLADPVQPKGGAVFEISRGSLDASMETQLAEIEQGLLGQLETRQ